jgi:hypothetical protein
VDTSSQTTDNAVIEDKSPSLSIYTPTPDEPMQFVQMVLPRTVLFALIDPAHPDANVPGAEYYGLLQQGELTPIGALVLGGTDQTALRHKLVAAWRAATNAALRR